MLTINDFKNIRVYLNNISGNTYTKREIESQYNADILEYDRIVNTGIHTDFDDIPFILDFLKEEVKTGNTYNKLSVWIRELEKL